MVYPDAGVAVSTGTGWDTSLDYDSANVGDALVLRDADGDFSAGVITANSYVGIEGGTF
jgi:ferredoxin-NADP reductase